jgi:hypothetical protein
LIDPVLYHVNQAHPPYPFSHLRNKRYREFLHTERGKTAKDVENLLRSLVRFRLIWLNNQCHCSAALGQSQFYDLFYFRPFLEFDIVFQSC